MKPVAMLWDAYRKAHVARNQGTSIQQIYEEMNPANSYMSEPEVDPSQSSLQMTTAHETLKQKTQLSHTQIPDPQKLCDYKCCFKHQILGDLLHRNRLLHQFFKNK